MKASWLFDLLHTFDHQLHSLIFFSLHQGVVSLASLFETFVNEVLQKAVVCLGGSAVGGCRLALVLVPSCWFLGPVAILENPDWARNWSDLHLLTRFAFPV